jgi:hypothetical protein
MIRMMGMIKRITMTGMVAIRGCRSAAAQAELVGTIQFFDQRPGNCVASGHDLHQPLLIAGQRSANIFSHHDETSSNETGLVIISD